MLSRLLLAIVFALLGALLMFASNERSVVVSRIAGVMGNVSAGLSCVASLIPFPIAPFAVAVFAIWFVGGIIVGIVRSANQTKIGLLVGMLINRALSVSVCYLAFVLLFGINYSARNELNRTIENGGITRGSIITQGDKSLAESCENWIRLANYLSPIAAREDAQTVLAKVPEAFANSSGIYDGTARVAQPKPSGVDSLLGVMMIEGIYVPFTGEALVNTDIPAIDLPFVACHEAAHSIGYAREDEANLVSMIVCGQSQDAFFRYSSAMAAIRYSLVRILREDANEYLRLVSLMSAQVASDFGSRNAYWNARRENGVAAFASSLNNAFLSYGALQKDGAESYEAFLNLAH